VVVVKGFMVVFVGVFRWKAWKWGIELQIDGGQKNNNMDNIWFTIGLLVGLGECQRGLEIS